MITKKDVFGYLLVTANSIKRYEAIAQAYWTSVVEMKRSNKQDNTRYQSIVVCINCSWLQRKKLSKLTGIPKKMICNVKKLKAADNEPVFDFDTLIAADSMVDDTFWGKTKVFDTEANIPRTQINPCIEVIYADEF